MLPIYGRVIPNLITTLGVVPPIAGVTISGVATSETRTMRGKSDRRTNGQDTQQMD